MLTCLRVRTDRPAQADQSCFLGLMNVGSWLIHLQDPIFLLEDLVEDAFVLFSRKHFGEMLPVLLFGEQSSIPAVGLASVIPDRPIEFQIRDRELGLALRDELVQVIHQPLALL